MSGTIFALIPPIVAIALALITKEVYLSLLIGILSVAFLFTGLNPVHAVETVIPRHSSGSDYKIRRIQGIRRMGGTFD